MKTSGKLFIAFGVVAVLVIGFLIGLSVDYPFVGKSSASGTIAKINNYRKTQSSISEIQLQSELISDTTKLKAVQQLLNFYYFSAVKMSGNVRVALDEANAVAAFKAANQNLMTNMTGYNQCLTSARTDLLMLNEISSAIMTRNKMILKSFEKKSLLTDCKSLQVS